MARKKSEVKNNGISNVVSSKVCKTKRSAIAKSLSSTLTPDLSSSNQNFKATAAFVTDTPDLVCLSHLRWKFVFQRPQHLMTRCGQAKRVFFIEEPIFGSDSVGQLDIDMHESGVWVVVPHLPASLSKEEANAAQQTLLDDLFTKQQIHNYICWYYTPMAMAFTYHLKPLATVYDCMDELSAFKGASPALRKYEAELFCRADLVFTGGQSLYEAKRDQHPSVYAFPSSVDLAHFTQARNVTEDPSDQANIPHPRLGFCGVIDERMDIELLRGIADARPDWHFVMVGPVVKIDPAILPQRENIHYLGAKNYKELPSYLAGWDLAMLPFARNEATRFISPTKTPEYLAAGKPVVSTSIRDVVRPYGDLKLVRIADTVEQFVAVAQQAMQEDTPASEWLSQVDTFLEQISWDRTWGAMMKLIDSAIAAQ